MTDNNGFKMFNNYYAEWVEDLTNEQLGEIVRYLFIYNIYGETPTFEKENLVLKVIFGMVKSHIDASNKKRSVNINNGKNGGAPLGNNNARKQPNSTENNPKTTQKQPKTNNIDIDTDIDIDIDTNNSVLCADAQEPPPKQKRSVFVPPTLEEAKQYAQDNNIRIDVSRFIDYYTANGWKVGRSSMKDWKAAMRNWGRRDGKTGTSKTIIETDGAIDEKYFGMADFYGK